jgi:diketogulonate reductase-like aldo/keto reductase
MIKNINDTVILNNGVKMPWLGLGTWQMSNGIEVVNAVKIALKHGYRSVDTAFVYGNEEGVGIAIKESGIPRKDLFITTKILNIGQDYESAIEDFYISLKRLSIDYLDLYLIHWPLTGSYKEIWRAMETLYKQGHIRAIGVCNFNVNHIEDLLKISTIVPAVNQVEFHPMLYQKDLQKFCMDKGIRNEAWSPLMQGHLDIELLKTLGRKYGKLPAQVVLRWELQNGLIVIPKSVHENRIAENADIFDFELSAKDMELIGGLDQRKRFGPDPEKMKGGDPNRLKEIERLRGKAYQFLHEGATKRNKK